MKKIILLSISLLFFLVLRAEYQYPVSAIPDTLLENANAVVRLSESVLEIQSAGGALFTEKIVMTILNKHGKKYADFVKFYNKERKIRNIKISIFDKYGDQIEKVKQSEINDFSAISGFSIYEDNRVKYYKPQLKTYPFTIVVEYEISYSGYIGFPKWIPQYNDDIAVEYASYKIHAKNRDSVRYLQKNFDAPVKITNEGNLTNYEWRLSNLHAFEFEDFSPPSQDILPMVYTAPSRFSYGGISGSLESWEDFGNWSNELIEGRDILSEETISLVNELVKGVNDTIEKVRRIYEYMQNKTRYVSIQVGIGGYQPFEAAVVDECGYGDCKALTNYTMSLLKAANIPSNYVLVNAGRNKSDILPEFPSQQFNHVILCVPLFKDSIWLECTSQHMPFGFLGSFTNDRHVLMITEEGGKLIKTPKYPQSINRKDCRANVDVSEDGSGKAFIRANYSGLMYDEVSWMINEDKLEQEKWMHENLDVSDFDMKRFSVFEKKERIPEAGFELSLNFRKYSSIVGKRMMIPLNLMNREKSVPEINEEREFDIHLKRSVIISDSVVFSLPSSYEIEYLPGKISLDSPYGQYTSDAIQIDGKVVYTRTLKVNKGTFPKDQYPGFIEFYRKIVKNDKSQIVLLKKG